eukprot:3494421-Prymnesium_polylepis.1
MQLASTPVPADALSAGGVAAAKPRPAQGLPSSGWHTGSPKGIVATEAKRDYAFRQALLRTQGIVATELVLGSKGCPAQGVARAGGSK